MVARINTGHSLRRSLFYNENKVSDGKATCLCALNYPKDHDQLTVDQKLNRFLKQAALNENVQRNAMHITLNFHPSEVLTDERMRQISAAFMEGIGLQDLPYLVYRHMDAGHPHLHIVSVKVRADGSRVETNNIGRNQAAKARLEIEQRFGLMRADNGKVAGQPQLQPVNPERVNYGQKDTQRAIGNVLQHVVNNYSFTSLPELNAVLQLYNIRADRGAADSRVFKTGGLLYHVLNSAGQPIGKPVKASDYYFKPTLKNLSGRYVKNEAQRSRHKSRVKNLIDFALSKKMDLDAFTRRLEQEGLTTVIRRNDRGQIYGITFVDHTTKCVFNGSALGKEYAAKRIQERMGMPIMAPAKSPGIQQQDLRSAGAENVPPRSDRQIYPPAPFLPPPIPSFTQGELFLISTDALLAPNDNPYSQPTALQLPKKKRKKRKTL